MQRRTGAAGFERRCDERENAVKKARTPAVWLSLILLATGLYILQYSVSHHGRYADEWILMGALLSSFAVATMAIFLRLPAQSRSMHRHARGQ
jgi:hypothetical protein